MKKININKKNSYSRPFFGLVRHPEARCRGLAPYPVVLESLGLRGGPKTAQYGQKRPKMTSRESKLIKPIKIAK